MKVVIFPFSALALLMALGGVGVGCADAQQAPAQAPSAGAAGGPEGQFAEGTQEDVDSQEAQDLREHHGHHHGGFEHFVFMAVETVGVSPEQQSQVDKISAELKAKMQPVHDAQRLVLLALADGVAAGQVDSAKIDAMVAGVSAAAGQQHAAAADALTQLHAVLRPEQRRALVDKVEAQWEMWKQANGDEKVTAAQHADGSRFIYLAKELSLSPEQIDKLKASFPASLEAHAKTHGTFDPEQGEEHMQEFRRAFIADAFDAKAVTEHGGTHSQIASWGAVRMARFYEALAPLLTPEQRVKVADNLRSIANKM